MLDAPPLPSHSGSEGSVDAGAGCGGDVDAQPASNNRKALARSPLIADLRTRTARLEDFGESGRGHRPREIEALGGFTAAGTQELELTARFHAFRRHPFSKRMRHGDDGFDQCTRGFVLWDFIQE